MKKLNVLVLAKIRFFIVLAGKFDFCGLAGKLNFAVLAKKFDSLNYQCYIVLASPVNHIVGMVV